MSQDPSASSAPTRQGKERSAAWPPWRWPLHWQILLGLVLGALIGYAIGAWAVGQIPEATPAADRGDVAERIAAGNWIYFIFNLLGDMFLNGLKLIVVPLVTSSIILAVASMGSGDGFGRLGGKTLFYYGCTSLIAILIGLVLVNMVKPGITPSGAGILEGQDVSAFASEQAEVEGKARTDTGEFKGTAEFLNVFREMVPKNIVSSAADNKLLGLIVVSLIIGYFLARYLHAAKETLISFTQGVYDITLQITNLVIALAPIGVLGLVGATVAAQYASLAPDARFHEFIHGILWFAAIALSSLLIHFFVVMPLILYFIARVNPIRHYQAMLPALFTAFSTATSSGTLPVTIECVEERAGVSNRIASFTLPLGATVNMDGTALYECVAAIFICQAFGIDLTVGQQFMIVVVALLTSIGVAGVPAASLVAIIVILQAVQAQLPADALPEGVALTAGLGLLFIFDRPLDMTRTMVNVFSDSVAAVTIAKTEGEKEILTDAVMARAD